MSSPTDEVLVGRGSPISLTAADGTALTLRSLIVRAVVDEPLAFTELEMVFDNPEGRALDGKLAVIMPPGARVTRFARDLGTSGWEEAQVVPRRTADQQLPPGDPRQAPPLLAVSQELRAGEQFTARVDAIPARDPTRIVVAYVEELRGRSQPYRIALAGLPRLHELGLRIRSRTPVSLGGEPSLLKTSTHGAVASYPDFKASRDLTLHFSGPRELGLRRDDMVVARLSPVPHDHPDPIDGLTILFDTSASQAPGFDAQVDRLAAVVAAIDRRVPGDIPLRVVAFDQGADTVFEGRLGGFGEAQLSALRERGALGASNLAGALRAAAVRGERRYQRLLLITDGRVTAGSPGPEAVRAEAGRLLDAGFVRVDVMIEGGMHDDEVLRALTALSPDHPGLVLHAALSPEVMASRLTRGVVNDVEVEVPNSAWVYPQRFDALQAGDDVLVYAGLEVGVDGIDAAGQRDELAVQVRGGEIDRAFNVPLAPTTSPLLADAWSGARASWLIDQARSLCAGTDRGLCEGWRRQALDWSAEHRVVNDLTALVVLPAAVDYARFGLGAGAQSPLLAVGVDGLEWRRNGPPSSIGVVLPARRGQPYALRPARLGERLLWDEAPAATTTSTAAVRRDSQQRHAARRRGRAQPVREDRFGSQDSTPPLERDSEIPDKDAGAPFGPRRTPDDAYEGNLLTVMNLLAMWDAKQNALEVASRWRRAQPGDVMALVALGEALEANDRPEQAARAYGSIVDLYPGRADMRRLAAGRLERLGEPYTWLVLDSYGRAVEERYDDPAGHRLYAFALVRAGYYKEAFDALVDGLAWARSDAKTRAIESVLLADLGLVAAAWIRRWPEQEAHVREALRVHEAELATRPSLRFVLSWDSEQADLDLHVRDGLGRHAFYRSKQLESGGALSDDMDAGHGLEAFVIDGAAGAFPYRLEVGYYARGAAQGTGKLEIVEHDGDGQLFFDERPFVVVKQRAYVDLGMLTALPSSAAKKRR
ncbi:hypothetical protein [Nannocystis sp.]|uniref:hypothetical protein n=1 Tax=Nannocystis sp. TaxID=1962667 RepID=UPI0025FE80AF|nr:hypothetical protein [Nannocystis sp.]MBK7823715.1 hypothetical protein [Nannocystis sp.]